MTCFYKFANEAEFLTAASQFLVEGDVPAYIGSAAVDVVGVIHKPTGETVDTDDGPMPVFAPLDGWHVNTTAPIAEWDEYAVVPTNPVRVFAGA